MGWLDDTMTRIDNFGKISESTSMRMKNMVYSAFQNAKTNKEIKNLYKQASQINFQERRVAVFPEINKRELLLTTGEANDNDVYDYRPNSKTAALDYLYGEGNSLNSIIVSGGENRERVCALIPFVHKAQAENIPVLALHTGNTDLEDMMQTHTRGCEYVSNTGVYYDVFRAMPDDDIVYLLYETMPAATSVAESFLHALVETVSITEGRITVDNLASFPMTSLNNKIEAMKKAGILSNDKYNEISNYYLAGSSESGAVRVFLSKLNRQYGAAYGSYGSGISNIKRMINLKGAVAIDVGNPSNDLLIDLALNHFLLMQSQGKKIAIVLDNIPISKHEKIMDLVRCVPHAIAGKDVISSLSGGTSNADDLFAEITGNIKSVVLFRHSSGSSCQKWSTYLGTYKKIRVRYNISQSKAFMNSNNSRGISVDETVEPRIRAETLGKLINGVACIHSAEGILIAEVKGP